MRSTAINSYRAISRISSENPSRIPWKFIEVFFSITTAVLLSEMSADIFLKDSFTDFSSNPYRNFHEITSRVPSQVSNDFIF